MKVLLETLVAAAFISSISSADVITTNRNAFLASDADFQLIFDDNLDGESPTNSIVQMLSLSNGIEIAVTDGASDSIEELRVAGPNNSFIELSDDGLSTQTLFGQTELDLHLDNDSTDPQQFTFTLPESVNGIGLYFNNIDGERIVFEASGTSGFVSDLMGSTATGFLGFYDAADAFSSFTLTHTSQFGGSTAQENFEIGRIILARNAVTAIPEPSSFIAFGVGIAGMGVVQYRRRKSASNS